MAVKKFQQSNTVTSRDHQKGRRCREGRGDLSAWSYLGRRLNKLDRTAQRYLNGSAPSINREFDAVDETGTIRRQKNNGLCNLVWRCGTTRRRLSG
jgi:hypothetical protein